MQCRHHEDGSIDVVIKASTMNGRFEPDDMDALLRYIKQVSDCCNSANLRFRNDTNLTLIFDHQLEITLSEKDDLLAFKDQRINALEAAVSQSTINSLLETTKARHPNNSFAPSTPNHVVSDDSGEVHPSSADSLDHSLSLIFHARSPDEDSTADDKAATDGRWNIPFDEASFDDLVAKSSSGERKRGVLAEIGFMPIGKPSLWHSSHGTGSSPLRPLALRRTSGSPPSPRRRLSKEFMIGKENVTPVKDSIGVSALFDVR